MPLSPCLPVGALEQHGPYLPVVTDTLIATASLGFALLPRPNSPDWRKNVVGNADWLAGVFLGFSI